MLTVSIENNDLSELKFSEPENNGELMYCEILNNTSPLYIQTPKLNFTINEKTIDILFKNNKPTQELQMYYELIKNIEDNICNKISEHSPTWFSQQLNQNTIKQDLFKSSILLPEKLENPLGMKTNIPHDQEGNVDFEIYNKNQNKLDIEYLKKNPNLECTFLITAKELIISSTQAQVDWEIVQILVHKKKNKIKGFGIREDKNKISLLKPTIKLEDEDKIEKEGVKVNLI